eukprot:279878-Chlamydomonas_euryale.AAC.6
MSCIASANTPMLLGSSRAPAGLQQGSSRGAPAELCGREDGGADAFRHQELVQATDLLRRILAGHEKALGRTHFHTLNAIASLAAMLCQEAELTEA